VGLIWYGQNYLIYPSAFPPGSRIGIFCSLLPRNLRHDYFILDVATPSEFDLPCEHLELKTEDNITLRCYLLVQQKDPGPSVPHMLIPENITEEEVLH